jgi:VanZ family protein
VNRRVGRLLWFWLPVFLWMAAIFYASSLEGKDIPPIAPGIDKLFHFVEYFILGFLLFRAFSRSSDSPNLKNILIASIFIASFYGATDEFHQRFVSGRTCDFFDFLIDMTGSCIGAWLASYKERISRAVDKAV